MSTILPLEMHFTDNETIAISSIEYFNDLEKLIAATPERVLVNFVIWRIVDSYSGYLGNFRKYASDSSPRSDKCFQFVFYELPISVNAYWVRNYFKRQIKAKVSQIAASIKEELKKLFKNNQWLDKKTKKNAIKKLNKMATLVAFPDEFLDDEKLYKRYENISVDESKYFESVLGINKFHRYESLRALHEARNRTDWIVNSYVAIVNAFYLPSENSVRKKFNIIHDEKKLKLFLKKFQPQFCKAIFSTPRGRENQGWNIWITPVWDLLLVRNVW